MLIVEIPTKFADSYSSWFICQVSEQDLAIIPGNLDEVPPPGAFQFVFGRDKEVWDHFVKQIHLLRSK